MLTLHEGVSCIPFYRSALPHPASGAGRRRKRRRRIHTSKVAPYKNSTQSHNSTVSGMKMDGEHDGLTHDKWWQFVRRKRIRNGEKGLRERPKALGN